jgi:hypothetical protein
VAATLTHTERAKARRPLSRRLLVPSRVILNGFRTCSIPTGLLRGASCTTKMYPQRSFGCRAVENSSDHSVSSHRAERDERPPTPARYPKEICNGWSRVQDSGWRSIVRHRGQNSEAGQTNRKSSPRKRDVRSKWSSAKASRRLSAGKRIRKSSPQSIPARNHAISERPLDI